MTAHMRDCFADLRPYPASATGAFTGETEVNLGVIDLDALVDAPQSIAVSLAGKRTAGSPAGDGTVVVSANWQEADDSGFSSNVQDVPDHEVIAAVSVVASAVNSNFGAGFGCFRGVSPSRLDPRGLHNGMLFLGTSAEKPTRSS